MIGMLILLVSLLARLALLVVIAKVFMSYFLNPYHPLRQSVDRIVDPFLAPIRRFVPPVGMIDFSPLILIVLLQVFSQVIIRLLYAIQ